MTDSTDWKDIVATIAPTLGTLLGGPLAGMATSVLAKVLVGKDKATPKEIADAVVSASPDKWVEVRKAEVDLEKRIKELGVDVEKIHAGDRASAREREAKTGDTFSPRALAIGVTLGFFGVLGYLMVRGMPPSGGDALLVMLGSLGTAWVSIIAYYFGSSSSSAQKTALLARAEPVK